MSDPVALTLGNIAKTLADQEEERRQLEMAGLRLDRLAREEERALAREGRAALSFAQTQQDYEADAPVRALRRASALQDLAQSQAEEVFYREGLVGLTDSQKARLHAARIIKDTPTDQVFTLADVAAQTIRDQRLLDPDYVPESLAQVLGGGDEGRRAAKLVEDANEFNRRVSSHVALNIGLGDSQASLLLAQKTMLNLVGYLRRRKREGDESARRWIRHTTGGLSLEETKRLARRLLPEDLQYLMDNFEGQAAGVPTADPYAVGTGEPAPFAPPVEPRNVFLQNLAAGEDVFE